MRTNNKVNKILATKITNNDSCTSENKVAIKSTIGNKRRVITSAKKSQSTKVASAISLVIVESPAKARTIEKYLGSKYSVVASMGHLIDLPKSRLGIDTIHDFEPEYMTIRGKASQLQDLYRASKKSQQVLLASDNDREGEAIAYHIKRSLLSKLPSLSIVRIVFNEITPQAIREAVKHPRDIDEAKVNAQKARRVLDRLVGYNLSPLLWKKVKSGLSAGRVQSVALKLVCDREKVVDSFIPQEYWSIEADFQLANAHFPASLIQYKGEEVQLRNEAEAGALVAAMRDKKPELGEVRQSTRSQKPKPPFTTSSLQQTAANRLGLSSKKTMQIAQQLYEGISIGKTRIGLITYMRTDSTRVSNLALEEARQFIKETFPAALPDQARVYEANKKAQDAHEAIRPTTISYTPDKIKNHLTRDQLRLYSLIWERFIASQMKDAKSELVNVDILVGEGLFRINLSRLLEPGFLQVIKTGVSKEEKKSKAIPSFTSSTPLQLKKITEEQHFTQGPSRFTDSSIIKTLEEGGIGRPSTYAPIISVLLDRYYVTRSNKQLVPTTLGKMISELLSEYFPNIVDVGFTASIEAGLDKIEEETSEWKDLIRGFYTPFIEKVEKVMESIVSYRGSLDEKTEITCEKCGKYLVKKLGRFGFFLACEGFPDCRNTKSLPLAACPKTGCGGDIISRRKGKGREFFGCSNYPACNFLTYYRPITLHCPKCNWFMVEKFDKKNGATKLCINPDCDYLHIHKEEEGVVQND